MQIAMRENSLAVSVRGVSEDDIAFLADVIVLNCGGTINMSAAPGRSPAGVLEQGLAAITGPMAESNTSFRSIAIFERPPDSSNIGEAEWARIIERLVEVNDRKRSIAEKLLRRGVAIERGGIVVTHGTDTLQITALIVALEFSVKQLVAPIIFTGSHSPIDSCDGSDGLSNLRKAIYVAKERFSVNANLVPAVYVVIGQDVHLASRLTKVRTMPDSDGHYFFSFPAPVGRITGGDFHLRIDQDYIHRLLPSGSCIDVDLGATERRQFGIVEHIVIDRFTKVDSMKDFKRRRGLYLAEGLEDREIALIIQGDFSGNSEFERFADELLPLSLEMPIFVGARKAYERLEQVKRSTSDSRIILLPRSMTHAKAQAKLRWLLSFRNRKGDIKLLLECNFAGEVFDAAGLPEWINYETFPDNKAGTEVVVVYPDIHWKVVADAISRAKASGAPRKTVYLYGFGDGHIPSLNVSMAEILQRYFDKEMLGPIGIIESASLSGLVKAIAARLACADLAKLHTYLERKYAIRSKYLRTALFKDIARARESEQKQMFERALRRSLAQKRARSGSFEIRMRNPEVVLAGIMRELRISIPGEYLENEVHGLNFEEWNTDLVRYLVRHFSDGLAMRIIKDAVASASRLLAVIGTAVDEGVSMRIRTLAVKSRSNSDNYETGNLLKVLGVESDDVPGWDTRYFVPRG
jgi:Asparaginase, N-terminal